MKRMLLALAFAVTSSAVAASASAQPIHGGTPLEMLGALGSQLNLNTSQQQLWDNAVALGASARDAAHARMDQAHAALQAELAKAEPDFASLATANDSAREQIAALHKQARDAWLSLYATFTPEQKTIARDAIKSRLARMEARRAAFQQRSLAK
jgi:hypothetical protein